MATKAEGMVGPLMMMTTMATMTTMTVLLCGLIAPVEGFGKAPFQSNLRNLQRITTGTNSNLQRSSSTSKTIHSPLFILQETKANENEVVSIEVNGGAGHIAAPLPGGIPASLDQQQTTTLSPMASLFTKIGMIAFIVGMCITLPLTLLPQQLLLRAGLLSKLQSEKLALSTGEFCARWLFRLVPFCSIETLAAGRTTRNGNDEPEPAIWVCNHTSMLDVFVLMAADRRLRGPRKRPIKIVYWKQLEDNPVTKLLFRQCGFVPVQMAANAAGEANDYDRSSFRTLLQETKRALSEGFDIGILPEGQLNPSPESGLLPAFSGAYTLAKLSRRPIYMMALHGVHRLWHPVHGMEPTGRCVKVRAYPNGRFFKNGDQFVESFSRVVGHFGQHGTDAPDWESWLNEASAGMGTTTKAKGTTKDDEPKDEAKEGEGGSS